MLHQKFFLLVKPSEFLLGAYKKGLELYPALPSIKGFVSTEIDLLIRRQIGKLYLKTCVESKSKLTLHEQEEISEWEDIIRARERK